MALYDIDVMRVIFSYHDEKIGLLKFVGSH